MTTITVYEISKDLSYQFFLPSKKEDSKNLRMACKPKSPEWKILRMYNVYPLKERGSFFHFDSDILIINEGTREILDGFWYSSELLPLTCEDEGDKFYLVNVLECINCLNKEASTWTESGIVEQYVFHRDRLPASGLFKLPHEHGAAIYAVTRSNEPLHLNFKQSVEHYLLNGLIFTEIWQFSE